MSQKRVAIIFGQPSPYRADFISYLEKHYPNYVFNFFYGKRAKLRNWEIDLTQITHTCEVSLGMLIIPRKFDNRTIIFSSDIYKKMNQFNPDVVVASEYNAMSLGALKWAKRHKRSYISWTDGTLYSERNIGRIQLRSRKKIVNGANAYIASSSKSKEAQVKYGANEERIYISYLTVDIAKYFVERNRDYQRNILYVGSLIERKGLDLLFTALSKIKNVDFKLNIAGDGVEKENLKRLAEQLGIAEKVNFLGYISESMKEVYAENDLFILPTREDCFGLVILEAMCASLPVIISKYADGAYDLVDPGLNGEIIDPYETDKVAEMLQGLLNNQNKMELMGKYSFEKAKQFSFENVSKPFISAIENAINKG